MRKRDKAWENYEKACAKAEDAYQKAVEPIFREYLKSVESTWMKLINGLGNGEFLQRRSMKELPCPFMAVKCLNEDCPCQTFYDFQTLRNDGGG